MARTAVVGLCPTIVALGLAVAVNGAAADDGRWCIDRASNSLVDLSGMTEASGLLRRVRTWTSEIAAAPIVARCAGVGLVNPRTAPRTAMDASADHPGRLTTAALRERVLQYALDPVAAMGPNTSRSVVDRRFHAAIAGHGTGDQTVDSWIWVE